MSMYSYIVCLFIFIVLAGTLRLPWLRFLSAFPSVVKQMLGYKGITRKDGARPAIFQKFLCCSTCCLCCSMHCLFCVVLCTVCVCVCKCILYCCHRVATQLQLTNISYHRIISYYISYLISYHTNKTPTEIWTSVSELQHVILTPLKP